MYRRRRRRRALHLASIQVFLMYSPRRICSRRKIVPYVNKLTARFLEHLARSKAVAAATDNDDSDVRALMNLSSFDVVIEVLLSLSSLSLYLSLPSLRLREKREMSVVFRSSCTLAEHC